MIIYAPYPRSKEEIEAWFKSEKRKKLIDIYEKNKDIIKIFMEREGINVHKINCK